MNKSHDSTSIKVYNFQWNVVLDLSRGLSKNKKYKLSNIKKGKHVGLQITFGLE